MKAAVSINLCSGVVFGVWLLFGGLQLPVRGLAFYLGHSGRPRYYQHY
jgi:hypothetical protein